MSDAVKEFYRNLPCLETERLVLRQAAARDVDDIYAYSSDKEATCYLRWGPHRKLQDTQDYLQEVLEEYRDGRDGCWVIELKQSRAVIGQIHLMAINLENGKAEVCFLLGRPYWYRGLMTEALRAVLECSFETLGLNRVEAWCLCENRAGQRVLEKAGMTKEGELRQYLRQKGALVDFCVYAILRNEFLG